MEQVEVSAADIARIAGVRASAVSNWRRRNEDFPKPVGGTDRSPRFNLADVEAWLRREGKTGQIPAAERLWQAVESARGEVPLPDALARSGMLLHYLSEHADAPLPRDDGELAELMGRAAAELRWPERGQPTAAWESVPGARELTMLREVADAARADDPGRTFEYLFSRFLDSSARSGVTATSPELAELMLDLAGLADGGLPGGTLLDPACGSGGILLAAAGRGIPRVWGQEMKPSLALVARLRLALASRIAVTATVEAGLRGRETGEAQGAGTQAFEVRAGDSLREDAYPLQSADAVVCNPPFADRNWGQEELADDPRWKYGVPARLESELAWVQHALAHVRPGGMVVMLMPPATATRPSGRRIRAGLLRDGALRAVISLPPRLAAHYALALQIWVLQAPAQGPRASHVLLADASRTGMPDARQVGPAPSWEELRSLVSGIWTQFCSDPSAIPADTPDAGVAMSVPVIDLLDDEVDLTPARHLPASRSPQSSPRELAERRSRLAATLRDLADLLPEPSQPADHATRAARVVTLEDLAQTGAVFIRRAQHRPTDDKDQAPGPLVTGRVLTGEDVARGEPPSRQTEVIADELRTPVIRLGDVLVPQIARRLIARVAADADIGAYLAPSVYLIRADPATIDPWFLAGILSSSDGGRQAMTSTLADQARFEPRRVRIPLLPLEEQQTYGETFRRLAEFARVLRETQDSGIDLVHDLTDATIAMISK
jgi:hypothetical protein